MQYYVGVSIKHTSGGCGGRKIGTTSPGNVRRIGGGLKKYFFGDERRMAFMWRKTYVSSVMPRNRDSVRESLWRVVCFLLFAFDTICLAMAWKGALQILKTDSKNYGRIFAALVE